MKILLPSTKTGVSEDDADTMLEGAVQEDEVVASGRLSSTAGASVTHAKGLNDVSRNSGGAEGDSVLSQCGGGRG